MNVNGDVKMYQGLGGSLSPQSTEGTRARGDAPCARLAAARACEGPVGPRGQAGLFGRVLPPGCT